MTNISRRHLFKTGNSGWAGCRYPGYSKGAGAGI